MKNPLIKKYLLVALFFFSSDLMASAESDFESGVKSFKAGDVTTAITYFEAAMQQGMNTVALYYNLASSYYKAGRYEEAKTYFKLVYKTEAMQDLAEYNLGLIAIKQKQWNLARQYFNSIVKNGKDTKLIKLSRKQLVRLTKTEPRVKIYLSTNYGYDTNILSANSDSVLNQSDNFYDLFAYADFLISGKRNDGWVADVSLFRIDYLDLNISDENQFRVGLKRTIRFNDWDTSARLGWDKMTYGGEDFQTAASLDLQASKILSKSEKASLRYRYENFTSDKQIYNYLEGSRQQIRFEYRSYGSKSSKQLYYELELNNRRELVTSNYAYNYSPTRHTLRGKYTHYVTEKWHMGADLSYRFSDYPSSPTMDRQDQQWKLGLFSDYYFDKTLKLSTKLQFTDNSSTEDAYNYDKSVVRIGVSKSF